MLYGGFFSNNVTININGSRCYPCSTPFLCSFPSMSMWTNTFSPMNFLSYSAGFGLGGFLGRKVMNFLC